MKCVALLIVFAGLLAVASAANAAMGHEAMVAKAWKHLQALHSHAGVSAASVSDTSCSLNPPAMSMDLLVQQSGAKAACKASSMTAYNAAQLALNLQATMTPTSGSVCVDNNPSQMDYYVNCVNATTYPINALNQFKTSVQQNAQPGKPVGVTTVFHLVMAISGSYQGQSASGTYNDLEKNTGLIQAIPNACDDADVQAVVVAFSAYVQSVMTAFNTAIDCMKAQYAAQGISMSISANLEEQLTIYTQLTDTYQPVESSKQEGQAQAKNAASALAAPAHVWLLTAAAAAAMVLAKFH